VTAALTPGGKPAAAAPVLERLEGRALMAVHLVPDPAFGAGGAASFEIQGQKVAMLPDGKFAAITGAAGMEVARIGADGSVDPAFGADGKAAGTAAEPAPQSIAVQPDGKIVVAAGGFVPGPIQFGDTEHLFVARYNSDGTRDASFDGDGILATPLPHFFHAVAVVVRPDGGISVAGKMTFNADTGRWAHVQLTASGAVQGVLQQPEWSVERFSEKMVALPDGSVVIGGERTDPGDFVFARVGPDGRPAGAAWEGDVVSPRFIRARRNYPQPPGLPQPAPPRPGDLIAVTNPSAWMSAMAVQPDGKILAGGSVWDGTRKGSPHFILARYNVDGTRDRSFGRGGVIVNRQRDSRAADIDLLPDGSILVVSETSTGRAPDVVQQQTVTKLRPNGSVDRTFGRGGKWTVPVGRIGRFSELVVQPDGKYVVFGWTGPYDAPRLAAARYVLQDTRANRQRPARSGR
jgi:uncharacterized delta-60 repeat protein